MGREENGGKLEESLRSLQDARMLDIADFEKGTCLSLFSIFLVLLAKKNVFLCWLFLSSMPVLLLAEIQV